VAAVVCITSDNKRCALQNWIDGDGEEIGDKCDYVYGRYYLDTSTNQVNGRASRQTCTHTRTHAPQATMAVE
jgi:hypothetical protein